MNRTGRIILLSIGVLEALVIYFHVLGLTDSAYWRWPWRSGHASSWFYIFMVLAGALMAIGIGCFSKISRHRIALAWMMLAVLVFQVAGLVTSCDPPDATLPAQVIEDRECTSYWTDARNLIRQGKGTTEILRQYPSLLPTFWVHSGEKPPGPVLFYYFLLRLFGTRGHGAAYVGAALIALVTAMGVPASYWLSRSLLKRANAALCAAALFALAPGVTVLYPQFDSCYPAVICALTVLWLRAIETGRLRFATAFGLLLAAITFFAYNVLVIGALLLGLTIIEWVYRRAGAWARIWRAASVAVGILLFAYFVLWIFTGFNPIATFRSALGVVHGFNSHDNRTYPHTLPSDLFNFLLATGRMLALLAIAALLPRPQLTAAPREAWILRLCLIQIAILGLSALLRGETTRLWCFMIPLVAIPAGWELAQWPPRWRAAVLFVAWMLLIGMLKNVEINSISFPM